MKNQINKSELFKMAWAFAKDGSGTSFSESLKIAWNVAKGEVSGFTRESKVSDIKDCLYMHPEHTETLHVLTTVKNNSKGFHKDIAEKGLEYLAEKGMDVRSLSEKQAWCVAFEFKNVA